MTFKRETRYLVAKITDAEAALDHEELRELSNLLEKVEEHRISQGKQPLECVVVESDWPNYEDTWSAIQRIETENQI